MTPYYDSKTKKTRHRSRYLGKDIDGKPKRMRQTLPRHIYSWGEFQPLMKILDEYKIEDNLTRYLSEKEANTLITLALNRVVRPLAMHQINSWYDGTYLLKKYGELPLSSQTLSTLLDKVGNSSLDMEFFRRFTSETATSKTLVYDITSLSSYSKLNRLLEYGYNRDHLDTPQANLSMVVDRDNGIPVSYDLYPGSIVDVSTLKNTLKKLQSYGVKDAVMVLDRGFFSTANMGELASSGLTYVIPAPLTLKETKQLISEVHTRIDDPNLLKMYNDNPLFVMPATLKIGDRLVKGYSIYDPKREQDERNLFYKQIHDTVARLRKIRLQKWMNPKDVAQQTAGRLLPYLEWKTIDSRFEVSIRRNAVSQRVNRMGKYVLLHNGDMDWSECLTTYKSKDIVEKGFDMLKNDITAANMQKETTLRGLLFVCFLSLLLRMRLMKKMQQSRLIENYTLEGLLLELEKTKLIDFGGGNESTTEMTRKQREILEKLQSCA